MRETDVPQEGNATLDGHRKVIYAKGADGRVQMVASAGWEVEEIVTRQAVDEFVLLAQAARAQALAGLASPLAYHMYCARMDETLLSQTSGLWRWRIRRHFRPEIFRKLSSALLQRYADALGITSDQLMRIE
ncbi:MAG: hypothetical protein A3I66_06330 [Burkholderiales bacterium RIFCSPLOWO2_02_FULL_57_36]|nr:MAG: hypothetical protein A3I66_06330 [Burkholderiales bacterium RIFCSPLOWO2_02_FULL_57_36]